MITDRKKQLKVQILAQNPYFYEYGSSLKTGLEGFGLSVDLRETPEEMNENLDVMLVIGPHLYKEWIERNPARRCIVFAIQTEQLPSESTGGIKFARGNYRWLRGNYNKFDWIFDWSRANVNLIRRQFTQCSWIPYGEANFLKCKERVSEKPYDVLFLGDPTGINNRRKLMLDNLRKNFRLFAYDRPLWGLEKARALNSCKVLLNIHYDDALHFEAPRFYEGASAKICLVSEIVEDPYPFRANKDYASTFYEGIPQTLSKVIAQPIVRECLVRSASESLMTATITGAAEEIYKRIMVESCSRKDFRYRLGQRLRHLTGISALARISLI